MWIELLMLNYCCCVQLVWTAKKIQVALPHLLYRLLFYNSWSYKHLWIVRSVHLEVKSKSKTKHWGEKIYSSISKFQMSLKNCCTNSRPHCQRFKNLGQNAKILLRMSTILLLSGQHNRSQTVALHTRQYILIIR